MKKETVRMIFLMLVCAVGALLIGFNAGHLTNGLNAGLFVIGIALVSMSTTIVTFLQTLWKRKGEKSREQEKTINGRKP